MPSWARLWDFVGKTGGLLSPDLDVWLSAGNALNLRGRRRMSTFSNVYGPLQEVSALSSGHQKPGVNKRFISSVATVMALRWSKPTRCFFPLFFCSCCSVQSAADRATSSTHLLSACRHRWQGRITLLLCHVMVWWGQQRPRGRCLFEKEIEEMAKWLMNDGERGQLSGTGSEGRAGEESGGRGWSSQLQMKKTVKDYLGESVSTRNQADRLDSCQFLLLRILPWPGGPAACCIVIQLCTPAWTVRASVGLQRTSQRGA